MSALALGYLNLHYGVVYEFKYKDGKYIARAKFDGHDELEADSAEELLILVRRHYRPGARDSMSI